MVANIANVDERRILPTQGMSEGNAQCVVPCHDPEQHRENKVQDM